MIDDEPDESEPEELDHGDECADRSGRWCAVHALMHPPGWMCEHWPRWVVEEIRDADARFRAKVIEHLKAGDRSLPVVISAVSLGLLPRSFLPPLNDDEDDHGDSNNAPSMN